MLLVTAAGLYGLTTHEAFASDPQTVTVEGLHYTDQSMALGVLGLADAGSSNLFRLRTAEMAAALRALPAIRDASVAAELPDRIRVVVRERVPMLAWRRAAGARLIDVEGVDLAAATGIEALPVIDDLRIEVTPAQPGSRLAPSDLEVARLLGAVVPADVGSAAVSLGLSVDDEEGWVMETAEGWRAVFGHYTPTLRPASSIPAQLACLAGILAADGEAGVRSVTLSLSDDGCGTFLPAPTKSPAPSVTPGPSRSPRP